MATHYYESEQCFRRYEDVIVSAVLSFPQEVRFKPTVRAITTDEARCRDAISAWRRQKWKTSIDPDSYKDILRQLVVWQSYGYVCVGPKAILRELRMLQRKPFEIDSEKVDKVVMPSGDYDSYLKSPKPEPDAKPVPLTDEEFNALSIEDAVVMLDEGRHIGHYYCENTVENLSRTQTAIGDRINVVYVTNKAGQIQIF